MREPDPPSLDELLAECYKISIPHPGGKTTREWMRVWGMSEAPARDLLRHAITTGRMKTEKTFRPDVMRPGKRVMIYLHRFLAKPKRQAKT